MIATTCGGPRDFVKPDREGDSDAFAFWGDGFLCFLFFLVGVVVRGSLVLLWSLQVVVVFFLGIVVVFFCLLWCCYGFCF